MHEAHAAGQHILDLSYTHPRGFIPNQILRRSSSKKLLEGWTWSNTRLPPSPMPEHWWNPYPPNVDLGYAPLDPFVREIELREYEAGVEKERKQQMTGERAVAILDTTAFHPRGGIPYMIMARLKRRRDLDWRKKTVAEIERLRGDANKDLAFAKTQAERAASLKDDGKDYSAMLASVEELKARAAASKAEAQFLESEMG
jgi:hypothetical protein